MTRTRWGVRGRSAVALLTALTLLAAAAGAASFLLSSRAELAGEWTGTVGNELAKVPVQLRIVRGQGDSATLHIVQGGREARPLHGTLRNDSARFTYPLYDVEITMKLREDGTVLGEWNKSSGHYPNVLDLVLERGDAVPVGSTAGPDLSGEWRVEFEGKEKASTMVLWNRKEHYEAVVVSPQGDLPYGYGGVVDGELELSGFDGISAFYFRATPEKAKLAGELVINGAQTIPWTATRIDSPKDDSEAAYEAMKMDAQRSAGLEVGNFDVRDYHGRVVVVDLFATWCANCGSLVPLLNGWHERSQAEDLVVVGVACELTGDPARDDEFVRRYVEEYDVEYPVYVSRATQESVAEEVLLPLGLEKLSAFPTTVFIGRNGFPQAFHYGFVGPAAPKRHEKEVELLNRQLEALLDTPEK